MIVRILNICLLLIAVSLATKTRSIAQMTLRPNAIEHAADATNMDSVALFHYISRAAYIGNQQPDSALWILNHALGLSSRIGYTFGVAKCYQFSGIIYSHTGRFEQGIEQLRRMIYYCLTTGKHTDLLAVGYNILGNIYQTQGKYEEAAYYYHKTLQIPNSQLTESTKALIYVNLSTLTNKLKQPQKALYYLSRAETIAAQNRHYDLLSTINSNRGMIYTAMMQTDSAMLFLRKARNLINEHGHRYRGTLLDIEYTCMVYMADMWLLKNNLDSAAACIQRIHEIDVPVVPLYWNKAHLSMGKYYTQAGDYKQAEHYLLKALDSMQSSQANNDLASVHLALTHLYDTVGNHEKALRHSLHYIRLKDTLENEQVSNMVHQLEVRYRTAEKDKELISQNLEISRQQSDAREKNLWIAIITGGMIVLAITLAALYKKRQAEKRLQIKEIQILRQRQQAMQQQQQAMQQAQEIEQLKAMMKGEERERGRLARELHDGIGGMLTAMKMNLSTARRKAPELTLNPSLTELMHMLEDTSSEVRKTAHNLMPDVLVQHALPEALMIFCNHIHKELETELSCQGDFTQLDKATELMLYRMVQELMQNVLKHASATRASIELVIYQGKLLLTVEDNGTGFDANEENSGFGLQNLRYRVAALQGKISITSDKNRSTIVHLEFDLEKLKMA